MSFGILQQNSLEYEANVRQCLWFIWRFGDLGFSYHELRFLILKNLVSTANWGKKRKREHVPIFSFMEVSGVF